jgi:Cu-Zn family superoxide dismutase
MLALSIGTSGPAHLPAMAAQPRGEPGPEAAADIKDAKGRLLGRATFTPLPGGSGVWVQVSVTGLPPGVHGIAVHEKGICEGPDFASAGGHFNPRGRQHGLAHREGAHAGDLPNMVVNDAGRARYEAADVDGNAGPGIACGVIARPAP